MIEEPHRASLLEEIASQIAIIDRRHPTRVGIDGSDGAGKTTFADELASLVRQKGRQTYRVSLDDFLMPAASRYGRGRFSSDAMYLDSYDYEAFDRCVAKPLGPGGDRRLVARYFDAGRDVVNQSPADTVPMDGVVVVDGVFIHRPELLSNWDYSIFLEVSVETAFKRAVLRDSPKGEDVKSVETRYRLRYLPAQERYFAEVSPESIANAVVDNEILSSPVLRSR